MGQRPMQSRFMPGVYVFPGGVTEKEDLQAYKFFKLKPNKQVNKKAVKSYSNSTLSIIITNSYKRNCGRNRAVFS